MKPILEIQNISKKFRISHEQEPYLSLRDSLASIFKPKSDTEDFWALQDVSFNANPGDTIGIIGKNGAGKSTLLKILSKITPPSSGKIISRGRIASLLEVGTGFHPELSGRENIFMNGSILGMKRSEIISNFDAIVEFADVQKFIDTPLKHYSSGMQLRLAFAVAAFLENEILIIDEVLAVGDAEFQKKCVGKMENVSHSGRTILFVSHNTASLNRLCQKGVYLKAGVVQSVGKMPEVINNYLKEKLSSKMVHEWEHQPNQIKLVKAYLENEHGKVVNSILFQQKVYLILHINSQLKIIPSSLEFGLAVNTQFNIRMLITSFLLHKIEKSDFQIKIELPTNLFCPGYFDFDFSIQDAKKNMLHIERAFCEFEILKDNTEFEYLNYDYGVISQKINWAIL